MCVIIDYQMDYNQMTTPVLLFYYYYYYLCVVIVIHMKADQCTHFGVHCSLSPLIRQSSLSTVSLPVQLQQHCALYFNQFPSILLNPNSQHNVARDYSRHKSYRGKKFAYLLMTLFLFCFSNVFEKKSILLKQVKILQCTSGKCTDYFLLLRTDRTSYRSQPKH